MPPASKLKMPPLSLDSKETLGERLARIRKEKGFTQVELAERIGSIQVLVSDYERGRLRPHAEMVMRLAIGLDVTTDELLGLQRRRKPLSVEAKHGRRFLRRLEQLSRLPKRDQDALLRTIDAFLSARGGGHGRAA